MLWLSAQEKYNSETVNIYMEGEGSPVEGMLNIRFYCPSDSITNININNSLLIDNPYEQEVILDLIMQSPYYSYETFGSKEFMQSQWLAHNSTYHIAKKGKIQFKIASLFSRSSDPIVSSQELDIRSKNNIHYISKLVYYLLELFDNW